MALFAPVSLGFAALGLGFIAIGSTFPYIWVPGLFFLWCSTYPYARWLSRKIHDDIAYVNRDHPLVEDGAEFAEAEEDPDLDLIEIIANKKGRGA